MTTWIARCTPGSGVRIAVKDIIDVAGLPTTAGSAAVAAAAEPVLEDAACLAGVRAAVRTGTATIVGKVNLHELALGITGINPWFGTPVNPRDPARVPGGSSSGSATAVAADEADIALGTDTGGSVRIPAACCGVFGLKTTFGRISTAGVRPLAPSLDTVGLLARDIQMLTQGMELLDPTFAEARGWRPGTVGRVVLPAAPDVDETIDAALGAAELQVVRVTLPGWDEATKAGLVRLGVEAWQVNGDLIKTGRIGADVVARLEAGGRTSTNEWHAADLIAERWQAELSRAWERFDVLALPTLLDFPPSLEDAEAMTKARATVPVNLAGVPALAMPVPANPLTASLQLIGPPGSEAQLLELGGRIAAAVSM
jgi:amidase